MKLESMANIQAFLLRSMRVPSLCMMLVFALNYSLHGQVEQIWTFGSNVGLNFVSQPPALIFSALDSREACASICNESGELLFYTEGSTVYDRADNIMPNGSDLTGLGFGITQSATQGALIVPLPGSRERYYIFSMIPVERNEHVGTLYYSVVDMSLNNGNGDIVPGEKGILLATGLTEQLTSTIARGTCGVWVLTCDRYSYDIKAYLIDQSGVNVNPIVSPGYGSAPRTSKLTTGIAISKDGTRLVDVRDRIVVYEFDAVTGSAASPLLIDNWGGYMACFSPNGSKLYVDLTQYDLNAGSAANISASRVRLGLGLDGNSAGLKLGQDGKIYVSRHIASTYNGYLDVIHFPDLAGLACQFEPNAINMSPAFARIGLPNVVSAAVPDTVSTFAGEKEGGCFANSLTLAPRDINAEQYLWSTGDTSLTLTVEHPGRYWVSYLTPCHFNTDTFYASFPNGVLPTIVTIPACADSRNGGAMASTFPGDPVNYTYAWIRGTDTLSITDSLSGVPSGSYSLHVLTDTGCDTLLHFTIPEEDFRVSFEASDTLICLGDTLQFTNTSDSHFTAFHWDLGNGDTFDVVTSLDYRYSENGNYRVLLAGTGEICSDTAYQTILVDQPIIPHFDVVPKEVCAGQPVYLRPYSDSTTSKISWTLGESAREQSDVQQQYQHAFDRSGTFQVTLGIQSRACPDTSYTDSIRVFALPEVDLGSDTSICLDGTPVYLKNLREAPLNPYHRVWSTGDTTAILKVVHPGVYTLSVTAGPIGCTTTESIEIRKDCYVDIPNAFTPNGDGHNDYFLPRVQLSESLSRFHMQVFNRWGQVVFETNLVDGRGWDGRFNDKVQPTGVYLYRIEAAFSNGRQEQYEGNVTLLR